MKKPATLLAAVLASFLFIFASAKNVSPGKIPVPAIPVNDSSQLNEADATISESAVLYNELHLNEAGLQQNIFTAAIRGLKKLETKGVAVKDNIITIIDFTQPSSQKRLYVVDLKNKHILFNTFVAHGRNSGELWAKSFSNDDQSLKSSPGFYVTAETYVGGNGYSLRLDGQEKNINDRARNRAIVMHGAPYVDQSAINSMGFLGRSWGCPAVPESLHKQIINTIKGGTCLFIYTNDKNYQQQSTLLNS